MPVSRIFNGAAVRRAWDGLRLSLGIFGGDTALAGPRFVVVDMTRRCNLRCIGCHYHGPGTSRQTPGDHSVQQIPLPLVQRLAGELRAAGTREVLLSGEGEPMLHPDIGTIIRTFRGNGMWVNLTSNGTLLDEAMAQTLLDSGLDSLKISLWAGNREEYALNYAGTPASHFDRVTSGIRHLSQRRHQLDRATPTIVIHRVINRHNVATLERMIDLAQDLGCDGISLSPLIVPRGSSMPFGLDASQVQEVRRRLERMKERLSGLALTHNIDETLLRYRIGPAVWERSPCYLPWFHARFKVDGTVLPCGPCDLAMGNLHESTFARIWNGPSFRAIRRRTSTRAGLAKLGRECDCAFCCFAENNTRIHRVMRWVPRRGARTG